MAKKESASKEISAAEKEIISSEQKIYEYDEDYQEKYLKASHGTKMTPTLKKYI